MVDLSKMRRALARRARSRAGEDPAGTVAPAGRAAPAAPFLAGRARGEAAGGGTAAGKDRVGRNRAPAPQATRLKDGLGGVDESTMKQCPRCQAMVPAAQLKCSACGALVVAPPPAPAPAPL